MLGLTDAEMADFFGVSAKTFTRWKLSKPEFCLALKAAKEIADARVERRLYECAVGYSVEIEKVLCTAGKVIRVQTVEHHRPTRRPASSGSRTANQRNGPTSSKPCRPPRNGISSL